MFYFILPIHHILYIVLNIILLIFFNKERKFWLLYEIFWNMSAFNFLWNIFYMYIYIVTFIKKCQFINEYWALFQIFCHILGLTLNEFVYVYKYCIYLYDNMITVLSITNNLGESKIVDFFRIIVGSRYLYTTM